MSPAGTCNGATLQKKRGEGRLTESEQAVREGLCKLEPAAQSRGRKLTAAAGACRSNRAGKDLGRAHVTSTGTETWSDPGQRSLGGPGVQRDCRQGRGASRVLMIFNQKEELDQQDVGRS